MERGSWRRKRGSRENPGNAGGGNGGAGQTPGNAGGGGSGQTPGNASGGGAAPGNAGESNRGPQSGKRRRWQGRSAQHMRDALNTSVVLRSIIAFVLVQARVVVGCLLDNKASYKLEPNPLCRCARISDATLLLLVSLSSFLVNRRYPL